MLAILVATSIPAALTPGAKPFFAVVQGSVGNAARTASDAVRNSPAVATGLFATASKAVQQSPAVAVGSFAAGVAAGCAGSTLQRCLDLYLTADDMPGSHLRQHRSIAAKVVAVSDGDTLRVRHTPTLLSSGKFKGKLSENTISVRIAAVDTPETAKFGQPGQPLGADAKAFTKRLLNRRVRVRCYARDQYGRIVGTVQYGIRPGVTCRPSYCARVWPQFTAALVQSMRSAPSAAGMRSRRGRSVIGLACGKEASARRCCPASSKRAKERGRPSREA